MPRYYFHLHDGTTHPDRDGLELADIGAARKHAASYLADLLRDGGEMIWNGEDWQLNVTDDAGLVYFTIHIVAVEAAAAKRIRKPGSRI